ncbi:MAG: rhomboid family intramembrane serine protease [bacterium]|nr:rhomboid family intramembrane serine protease [bacterium]
MNRQTSGSVVCPSCGKLVGVQQEACPFCGRKNPGMWGFAGALRRLDLEDGATHLIVWGCIVLYVLSLVVQPSAIRFEGLFGLLSPGREALVRLGASGALPVVVAGRWWTVLTAGWLHGGLLHIFFNMMWVRQLAPATTHLYGPGRMLLIYLISSVVGFVASSFGGAYLYPLAFVMGGSPYAISVGASAAVFGLLGAMVYAGRRGIAAHLGRQAWGYAIALFVFGLIVPGVDNWAHLGGFVGGFALARMLNPSLPEKLDHTVAAVVILIVTLAAIGLSFVVGFG